ncbi:unnamed protein product [Aureobasidium uvarum]|uniref:F-box domain-containing protein n=1 Tax=Aureobasidium uvarum TaxID=2773716 RepID=A0A9N8PSD7_9PEZI|nr:unnamed protein product [Aureobasidium uvarum]
MLDTQYPDVDKSSFYPPMAQLSTEILRTIFILIREEQGLRALIDLSSVCRAWRDVAQPVLWSHVVLTNDTLEAFVDNYKDASERLETVRSVTFQVEVITLTLPHFDPDAFALYRLHGFPQNQTLLKAIDRFSTLILPKLTSLDFLSLFVDDPPIIPFQERHRVENAGVQLRIGFRLQTEVLGFLLRNLPASCTSLELDTGSTDWSPGDESHHLCSDICICLIPRDKTYPMPLNLITAGVSGLYDKFDNCVIGDRKDLRRHAEHTVWDETVYGARMPFGVKMARAGATPKPSALLTRREWRRRSKKAMLSWRKEEGRTGVKIRRVIPLDSIDIKYDYSLMSLLPARGDSITSDGRVG